MGITLTGISKTFGNFIAVDNLNLKIKEGEFVALLGPSGSGKSTILRIIAGLERPDTGRVYLNGEDVTTLTTQKRRIGFVFQHYALFKHMNVRQNIAFGLEIRKKGKSEIDERVKELISLVKLEGYENHFPAQLSGGQRQRVALARTLATDPKVLLLDEPFGALDAKVRDNLAKWLKELHSRLRITSLFVTHDQSEAIEISDKIVVINRGKVEQTGRAQEIYEQPKSRFVASFIGNVNIINAIVKNNRLFIKGTDYEITNHEIDTSSNRDVIILIRPEDTQVVKGEEAQGCINIFPCRLIDTHYRGSFYEVNLKLGEMDIKAIDYNKRRLNGEGATNREIMVVFRKFKIFEAFKGHGEIHEQLRQLGYIE